MITIFIYENFAAFEIILASYLLNTKHTVQVVAEDKIIKSSESVRNNQQHTGLVIDKNMLTALPEKYVDFAIELGKLLDIYENEADYAETQTFFHGNNIA